MTTRLPNQRETPYTVRDVARLLGISRFTVYELIKRGELAAYRVGNRLRIEALALLAYKRACAIAGGPEPHEPAEPRPAPPGPRPWLELIGEDGGARDLRLGDLQALGPTTVMATRLGTTTFTQHRYTGVLVHDLLLDRGVVRPVEVWRAALSRFVLAVGADGHMVALTLGEIDPGYSNVPALVAWERNGGTLNAADGPLLLVVPSDHRGGRYVRGLTHLLVRDGATACAGRDDQGAWAGAVRDRYDAPREARPWN